MHHRIFRLSRLRAVVAIVLLCIVAAVIDRTSSKSALVSPAHDNTQNVSSKPRGHEIEEPRLAGIEGRVFGDFGPLAGARVCCSSTALRAMSSDGVHCITTDQDGRYALSEIPTGRYSLSAIADGYALQSHEGGVPRALIGGRVEEVDFRLIREGAQLSGIVLDGTGGIIANAEVQLLQLDSQKRVVTELGADAQGAFKAMVAAGPIVVSASAEGYALASVRVMAPADGVQLVLMPGATIRGIVLNARTRDPLEDVDVRAFGRFSNPSLGQSGASDENGEFVITGLTPGRYSVVAESDSGRGGAAREINLSPGEVVRRVEVLMEPAVSVSGRVERDVGGPCERGFMMLGPPSAATPVFHDRTQTSKADPDVPLLFSTMGPDGEVRFRGATAGVYQATVQCADHVIDRGPLDVEVAATPLSDIRWIVTAGIAIRVRIVDDAGRPVPHAPFALEWRSIDGRRTQMALQTNGDGIYVSLRNLTPGEYRLLAGGRDETSVVHVERGSAVVDAELRLAGSGSITVTARNANGEPIDGLRVLGRKDSDPGDGITGIALGSGRYRLGPLVPGSYAVTAEDGTNPIVNTGAALDTRITVTSGNDTQLNVLIPRGGIMHGRVLNAAGEPVANAWVSTHGSGVQESIFLNSPRALTNAAGEFELSGLERDALYDVTVIPPTGLELHRLAVSLASDVELRVESAHSGQLAASVN